MGIVVQKFGGTSLDTYHSRNQVIKKIIDGKEKYGHVVVVVSAMGRLGQPYATDTLLGLLDNEGKQVNNRELDLLLACGEVITTVVLSNSLKAKGIHSEAITGGQSGVLTSEHEKDIKILKVNKEPIVKLLDKNITPIVAGFQGMDTKGNTTTLGRGGSDTSAMLLAEAINADCVEIFTDVDGIMTADPKICQYAKKIDSISYTDVFQMADNGARVIHPKAIDVARKANIPVNIRNTFSDTEGTYITHNGKSKKSEKIVQEKLITAIAHNYGRIQFMVEGNLDDEIFFNNLANEYVSIDIINIFPEKRVFTTEIRNKKKVIKLIKKHKATFTYIDECCKVTVIGEGMTGVPGVMAKIISSLSKVDVQILQTADSLSTIACLVYEKDIDKAVLALHKTFRLED